MVFIIFLKIRLQLILIIGGYQYLFFFISYLFVLKLFFGERHHIFTDIQNVSNTRLINLKFKFKSGDTLLFGRESAGAPEEVHTQVNDRLTIPIKKNKRSLNLSSSVSMVVCESLRQIKLI